MNSLFHAKASARRWGGTWQDYIKVHKWMDQSKKSMGDVRHRAVRHHAEGIFEAEEHFGVVIKVGRKEIPVREILENHIVEDLGFIPTCKDWLSNMEIQPWMNGARLKQTGSFDDVFGGNSE